MKKIFILLLGCLLTLLATTASATQSMREFNPDSLASIVSSQKGQPFVLVIWSLDCEFCQASLSNLSKKRRAHSNLKVITLATDSLADKKSVDLMKKKLASLGLSDNAWAFGATSPEQLRYAIDKKWHGEMPRSYWFKASGESVAQSGVITPEAIDKFLAAR